MAWDDEAPIIVRALLQDKGATLVYADDAILEMFLVAGLTLQLKRPFEVRYAINLDAESIAPDPTATPRDDAFLVAAAYAAVIAFVKAEIRSNVRQGIRIKDGDSELDLKRDPASLNLMLQSFERELDGVLDGGSILNTGGEAVVGTAPHPWRIPILDRRGDTWCY